MSMQEAVVFTDARNALRGCLDVMLRMIPDYVKERGCETCTDAEHNKAIGQAAAVLYGKDRKTWPKGIRAAAEGRYA